jgi:hypothetical protein
MPEEAKPTRLHSQLIATAGDVPVVLQSRELHEVTFPREDIGRNAA